MDNATFAVMSTPRALSIGIAVALTGPGAYAADAARPPASTLAERPALHSQQAPTEPATPPTGAASSSASQVSDDGVYGRFAGDLEATFAATASFRPHSGLGVGAGARALYLSTAGLYAAFDTTLPGADSPRRTLAFGTAIRPLFLPRWAYDLERGPAWVDLTLDSLTLELGALWTWSTPRQSLQPGFEVALAVEVPLANRVSGAWLGLRGAAQWTALDLAGSATPHGAPSVLIQLALAWHSLFSLHLVDAGDTILR